MPDYKFKAINAKGETTESVLSAASPEVLADLLAQQGLFLMESKAQNPPPIEAPRPVETPRRKVISEIQVGIASLNDTVPLKDVTVFTRQWAVMTRTSLPILESLDMLSKQASNEVLRNVLSAVGRDLRQGVSLSQAFGRYPKVFDEVYVSLLAAGEVGGKLDVMLDRLAGFLEFQVELKQKVRAALIYPSIVVLTAVMVVAFLVIFVLPTFMDIFSQFNVELPFATRALIFASTQVRHWWYLVMLALGGLWWYFSAWLLDPLHIRTIHRYQIQIPIAGELVRNIVMTRILRTLASLIESGVPILKALQLSKAAAGNVVFGDLIDDIMENVKEGRGLALALAESPYIPAGVVGMVSTGEKTGTLPDVVNKVASYYEAETDASIKNFFAAIEPIFIVGLALLVGGIALSVLLPMFDLAKGIQ